jgi:hypothetical protein
VSTTTEGAVELERSRVLRVFFDWGHLWPLWESGTDKYAMEPSDYGFSPELVDILRQWRDAWVPVTDFDIGETQEPPTIEQYDRLQLLRETALAQILREAPHDVVVSDETD